MKFSDNKEKDSLIKAGLVVALFYTVSKIDSNYKKSLSEADLADKPAASQAAAIKTLLRPYGYMWMRWLTGGVKVDEIMNVAKQITDLNAVVNEYQKMVGDGEPSMHDDLELVIGPELHQKFLSLATKGKTGSWYYAPQSPNVPANYWVITKADANIRRNATLQKRPFANNVVKTVPKGMILGSSTGKFAYDEENKVLFIEFWTLLEKENKRVTYFVAKSQVELLSQADKLAREKKEGKLKLQLIEGISGLEEQSNQEVITISQAIIYNEKFKQVGLAPANIIVGFPLMTLNTGKGKYLQVKTVQGLLRWIDADKAQIRERRF